VIIACPASAWTSAASSLPRPEREPTS
jgi:hypothetical protein